MDMIKRPFSFFLELLLVLLFFLICTTIFVEIYANMMSVSKNDTYTQDAMILASNEIENDTSVGEYKKTYHGNDYLIRIREKKVQEYQICVYHDKKKVLDYMYYSEGQ